MNTWRFEVYPDEQTGRPCHVALVRAATERDAEQIVREDARIRGDHSNPLAKCLGETSAADAARLQGCESILIISYDVI